MSEPKIDRYVRENHIALQVFDDRGQNEFNGVDGRTLHAFARRGLVWFTERESSSTKRYTGGLTDAGREVLAVLEFDAAEARSQSALEAYERAYEMREEAEERLRALQCGQLFTYSIPGPYPDEEDVVLEEHCQLHASHDPAEHAARYASADEAGAAYAAAHEQFVAAMKHASKLMRTWEEADEELEKLRCAFSDSEHWTCLLRRDHDGDHVHPRVVHLVL